MSKKLGLITCPNPKCHRKIEELILVSDMSKAPTEHYYACPHCFIKVDVISRQPQKERGEKKKKEEPQVRPPKKKARAPAQKGPSRCAGYLGYLQVVL